MGTGFSALNVFGFTLTMMLSSYQRKVVKSRIISNRIQGLASQLILIGFTQSIYQFNELNNLDLDLYDQNLYDLI